ncbi:molybdopterin-binding protein [Anaerolineales bacterium]
MLSVKETLDAILTTIIVKESEIIPLRNSLNRIIAQDIFANEEMPSFDNSSMDGFAIIADDSQGASPKTPKTLQIVAKILAGDVPNKKINRNEAAIIMTGAALPEGANAVIPIEDTDGNWDIETNTVRIFKALSQGDYIRKKGENIQKGELILERGSKIRAQEIGLLAGLGIYEVPVIKKPRIAILSTGDELLNIDEPLSHGKIRDINSYLLEALCKQTGAEAYLIPKAADQLDSIRDAFQQALNLQPDLIISSAGVSVGSADYVQAILKEIGSVKSWRVNMRPGKPLLFGTIQQIPFLGLPGNPVSASVSFEVFVLPAILALQGAKNDQIILKATLTEAIQSDGRETYARVYLTLKNGDYFASITGIRSSSALISMVKANGLLRIPAGLEQAQAGEKYDVILLKNL